MCVMNNKRISSHYILFLLLILVSFSVGIHFLHDLQPGHSDILGSRSGVCNGAIHNGFFVSLLPSVIFVTLLISVFSFYRQFPRLDKLSVFVPPPIQ